MYQSQIASLKKKKEANHVTSYRALKKWQQLHAYAKLLGVVQKVSGKMCWLNRCQINSLDGLPTTWSVQLLHLFSV